MAPDRWIFDEFHALDEPASYLCREVCYLAKLGAPDGVVLADVLPCGWFVGEYQHPLGGFYSEIGRIDGFQCPERFERHRSSVAVPEWLMVT